MNTMRKFGLLALLAFVPAVLAGCSCAVSDCAPPPRPRPAPVVCNPCAALPTPAPVVAAAPANFCQIVPPGTTIYSDPPTVTLSSTGQVVNRTGAKYYPARAGAAMPAPQATAVSTTYVPRSANVRTI